MKYLKKFANIGECQTYEESLDVDDNAYPFVAYIEDTRQTIMRNGYDKQYFTIEMLESGTLNIYNYNTSIVYYRINTAPWNSFSTTYFSMDLSKGDKVKFKKTITYTSINFKSNAAHRTYGCLSSLCYGENFQNNQSGGSYYQTFYQDSGLKDAENLILPVNASIDSLFGNSGLVTAPKVVNLLGNNASAWYTFGGCNKLEKAPQIINFNGVYKRCEFYNCNKQKLRRINIKGLPNNGEEPFNFYPEYLISNDGAASSLPEVYLNNIKTNLHSASLNGVSKDGFTDWTSNFKMYCDDFDEGLLDDYDSLDDWFEEWGQYGRCYSPIGYFDYDGGEYLLWMLDNAENAGEEGYFMAPYILTEDDIQGVDYWYCQHNYNVIEQELLNDRNPWESGDLRNPIVALINTDGDEGGYDLNDYFLWHCIPYLML